MRFFTSFRMTELQLSGARSLKAQKLKYQKNLLNYKIIRRFK